MDDQQVQELLEEGAKDHFGRSPVLLPNTRLIYRARGAVRECAQWDERGNRFLVSLFEGGMGAVPYQPGLIGRPPIKEQVLVDHPPLPGLSNLGFRIDYHRNRVVCCATDKIKLLRSTIVAYDYTTWKTLFVVELAGSEAKALADDLTIDPEGDIYVTDSYNGKIWKVKSDGSAFHIFSDSPLYKMRDPNNKYFGWVRLNGISYHPHGFLLVAHTGCSALFKVSMDAKRVKKVFEGLEEGIQLLGDGLVLLQNNNSMALAGLDVGVHMLETKDAWESVTVTQFCPPPSCLLATAVSLKDDRSVFASFVFDIRHPHDPEAIKTLTIGQPMFRPLPPSNFKRVQLNHVETPGPLHYINLYSGLPVDL